VSSAALPSSAGAGAAQRPVSQALLTLWGYIRHNLRYYAGWSVLTLIYVGLFVAVPPLVGWAIAGIGQGPAVVGERCAWLLAAVIARASLRFFSRTLVFNAAREVEYEIRNDLFDHLQRLPQSFYSSWRTGDLMSRCVNDLSSVRLMLGMGLLSVVQTPILFVGAFGAMFYFDPFLALLVAAPYPAFIWIAKGLGPRIHSTSLGVQEGLADISNQVQEAVSGVSVVKAYAMEGAQEERFQQVNEELFHRQLRFVKANAAMPAITGLLPAVAMWMVLMVGGQRIASGGMGVDEFFTFSLYIYELTFPTFLMGWVVALVQRGAAAMQRIDEVLATEPSIANRADTVPTQALAGEIEFRDLSVAYSADRDPALRDVSLRVPAGSTLGVVGPVGSGKTTLASVIPRLFEVGDGHVFIDGIDVNRLPLDTLRRSIAMVPQDSFLFSVSLADNIAFGVPEADRGRIVEAAERAQLAKDITELPNGYDTVVGERGVMLSGGQRQRTALARALALRPSILILDDTLSAVDAETEEAIQQGLREVFAGRTVVVVANRIRSVRDCDQIVVLDGGRVVERGRHGELLAAGGLYARLAREQEDEAEREALGEVLDHELAATGGGALS